MPLIKLAATPAETTFIRNGDDQPAPEKFPLIVSLCEKCRLVQMQDVTEPNQYFARYPLSGIHKPGTAEHFEAYARDCAAKARLQKGDLVIDIGCGDGLLLGLFKKMGMTVIGIDPSDAAEEPLKKLGVPHVRRLFSPALANDIKSKHGTAALVTANGVINSMDNLHALIAGVRFLLKQQGLFVFEDLWLPELMAQNRFDCIHHERLSFLTLEPLEPFLRSTMMHLIDATRTDPQSGSWRGVAQRDDGPYVVAPAVNELKAEEQKAQPATVETFNAFAARIEALKASLNNLVNEVSRGRLIAGYGASSQAVTIVHELGWDHTRLAFIADDHPAKHGMCLPGTQIPIVKPARLMEPNVAATVIFAHDHRDRIVRNNAAFAQHGGAFISLFPMPQKVAAPGTR